jgi:hypothetical protein
MEATTTAMGQLTRVVALVRMVHREVAVPTGLGFVVLVHRPARVVYGVIAKERFNLVQKFVMGSMMIAMAFWTKVVESAPAMPIVRLGRCVCLVPVS